MNEWYEAEAHVDRALELFERGRWAEAEAELRKALALNPDQPEWHFNLGLTLEAAGRDAEAFGSFIRATELLGDSVAPLLSAGLAAARLGRFEDSIELLDRALRLDSRNETAHACRIDNLTRIGRCDEAVTAFYVSLQEINESAMCYAAVAEALIQQEQFAKAEWCLKESLRISPNLPRVRAQLGRVFAATDRPHRALQMYLRELRDDPGNIEALLDYGDLLFETGRLPEAAEKFRRVLELQPANPEAHMRLGEIALAMNRDEQAHLEFELVLKLDPGYPDARTMLAETLIRRGRLEDARLQLEQELERLDQPDRMSANDQSPDHDVSECDLIRLGRVLIVADMNAQAATVIERHVDRGPDTPETLRLLALAYFRAGRRDRGVAISRRVLRQDPKCVESMHNLALAALDEGRLRVAAGWIHRGLRVASNDEGLRRLRMRLWWQVSMDYLRSLLSRDR